jgi:hypothetical protein
MYCRIWFPETPSCTAGAPAVSAAPGTAPSAASSAADSVSSLPHRVRHVFRQKAQGRCAPQKLEDALHTADRADLRLDLLAASGELGRGERDVRDRARLRLVLCIRPELLLRTDREHREQHVHDCAVAVSCLCGMEVGRDVLLAPTNGRLHVNASMKFGSQYGCCDQLYCRMVTFLFAYLMTAPRLWYTSR